MVAGAGRAAAVMVAVAVAAVAVLVLKATVEAVGAALTPTLVVATGTTWPNFAAYAWRSCQVEPAGERSSRLSCTSFVLPVAEHQRQVSGVVVTEVVAVVAEV
jgi:hypothetical protein